MELELDLKKRRAKVDFRPRCKRCRKIPRGKMRIAEFKRYTPGNGRTTNAPRLRKRLIIGSNHKGPSVTNERGWRRTMVLRWLNGVLQQKWELQSSDGLTDSRVEWRDVEVAPKPRQTLQGPRTQERT